MNAERSEALRGQWRTRESRKRRRDSAGEEAEAEPEPRARFSKALAEACEERVSAR